MQTCSDQHATTQILISIIHPGTFALNGHKLWFIKITKNSISGRESDVLWSWNSRSMVDTDESRPVGGSHSFLSSCICEHVMWGRPKIKSRMEPESCWLLSSVLKHTQPGVDLGGVGFLFHPRLLSARSLSSGDAVTKSRWRGESVWFLIVGGKFSDGAPHSIVR